MEAERISIVIGLMSGTSLDGLDIAACRFTAKNNNWKYEIVAAETIPYDQSWIELLRNAEKSDGENLVQSHTLFGQYLGKQTQSFIDRYKLDASLIASHGHTIFHKPSQGYTLQIGSGSHIVSETGLPVACDFRSLDIALGGQGAPLVPIGDQLLFSDYTHCLNLGGFANISFERDQKRLAFDICPANYVLNFLSQQMGEPYDDSGKIALSGTLNEHLLQQLNALDYYKKPIPKSLGREWVEEMIFPALSHKIPTPDLLRTFTEHIAIQVARATEQQEGTILVTGGGAYNRFLMDRITSLSSLEIIIPDSALINYKEALVFAFLGLLRFQNKTNVLSSVTGSSRDHSAGSIYLP